MNMTVVTQAAQSAKPSNPTSVSGAIADPKTGTFGHLLQQAEGKSPPPAWMSKDQQQALVKELMSLLQQIGEGNPEAGEALKLEDVESNETIQLLLDALPSGLVNQVEKLLTEGFRFGHVLKEADFVKMNHHAAVVLITLAKGKNEQLFSKKDEALLTSALKKLSLLMEHASDGMGQAKGVDKGLVKDTALLSQVKAEFLQVFKKVIGDRTTSQEGIPHFSRGLLDGNRQADSLTAERRQLLNAIIQRHTVRDAGKVEPKASAAGMVQTMDVMPKLQQFVLHVPSQANQQGVDQEAFINEFQRILAKSQLTSGANGTTRLTLKLFPEHLGSLNIELVKAQGGLTARIVAMTTSAKEMIDSQLTQLKQAFSSQHIQVDKVVVDLQSSSQTLFKHQGQEQPLEQEQRGDVNQESPQEDEPDEEGQSFQDILLNLKV